MISDENKITNGVNFLDFYQNSNICKGGWYRFWRNQVCPKIEFPSAGPINPGYNIRVKMQLYGHSGQLCTTFNNNFSLCAVRSKLYIFVFFPSSHVKASVKIIACLLPYSCFFAITVCNFRVSLMCRCQYCEFPSKFHYFPSCLIIFDVLDRFRLF